jgi:di/tricarboxylate transporter
MEQTGLAQTIVDAMVRLVGSAPPIIMLSSFFLLTWFLTELLSNNAVAVLLTPIALGLAQTTGINPNALLMVVIFGASCSFVTPQGYQTNAIVMGPGGYRFVDYVRFGLPLGVLCWLAATIFIPIFWPL